MTEERKKIMIERIEKKRQAKKKSRIRKKIGALSLIVCLGAVSMGTVYNASAKEITITEINEFEGINESITVKTRVSNVGEVLKECGLSLGDADRISKGETESLLDNDDITITRGKRITIKSEQGEKVVTITKADLTDALVEAGYIPGEEDEITSNGTALNDSDQIELVSVSVTEEKTNSEIEFETEYKEDSSLPVGETRVVNEGSKGNIETVYKVTYRDGQEASRELVSETITDEPQARIVAKGTAPVKVTPSAGKGSVDSSDTGSTINGMRYSKKITMTATAYSTSPSENGGYNVSAMGNPLKHGIVAVDPSVIPLNSKVYVESADGSWTYGVASAEDTGGAIKGNKIDLCYEGSVSEVNKFGRRSCNVYILE